MKRGLITWNTDEISREDFAARQREARVLLKSMELPALVVYSDLWRSNHARYLTNFMPYFNRALLIVPLEGTPVLLCGLSPRVYPWIRSVTTLEDIRPAGNFAAPLLQIAAERVWERIGIVEANEIPHDIAVALAAVRLHIVSVPADTIFRPAENRTEINIRRSAANLCRAILAEELPNATGMTDYVLAGTLERRFRMAGAEDLVLLMTNGQSSPAPARGATLEDRCSVSVALEYRGHWVRVTRPNCTADLLDLCHAAWKNGPTFVEDLSGAYPFTAGIRGPIVSVQTEIQVAGKRLFYGDTCVVTGNSMELL